MLSKKLEVNYLNKKASKKDIERWTEKWVNIILIFSIDLIKYNICFFRLMKCKYN